MNRSLQTPPPGQTIRTPRPTSGKHNKISWGHLLYTYVHTVYWCLDQCFDGLALCLRLQSSYSVVPVK